MARNMKDKIYYTYITTNLINGKQYVGEHACCDLLKDNYKGSGRALKLAFLKYGFNNFSKTILEFNTSRKEAFDTQEKYIIMFNTLSPNGYNLSPKGGLHVKGSLSEAGKERSRISNMKTWSIKGKEFNGENNPDATLSNTQVLEIYELGIKRKEWNDKYSRYKKGGPLNYYEIADLYNTSRVTVQHIINGFQWSSITGIKRTYKNGKEQKR